MEPRSAPLENQPLPELCKMRAVSLQSLGTLIPTFKWAERPSLVTLTCR